jgi:hypothetical protein
MYYVISGIANIQAILSEIFIQKQRPCSDFAVALHMTASENRCAGMQAYIFFKNRVYILVASYTASLIDKKIVSIFPPAENCPQGMNKQENIRKLNFIKRIKTMQIAVELK